MLISFNANTWIKPVSVASKRRNILFIFAYIRFKPNITAQASLNRCKNQKTCKTSSQRRSRSVISIGKGYTSFCPVCMPGTWEKNKLHLKKKPVWCCLFLMVFWRRCMLSRAMGCLLVLRNWFMSCTKMFISRLFLGSNWIRDLCAIRILEFPNPNLQSKSRSLKGNKKL